MSFESRMTPPTRKGKKRGPTETRTRIVGFKVQSDSHYTIGPRQKVTGRELKIISKYNNSIIYYNGQIQILKICDSLLYMRGWP